MRTLRESIIGRKFSQMPINNINDIKTGDIVKLRNGSLAIAYINGDTHDSGFYYISINDVANMIMSSMFSKDLKHKIVDYLDIIAVYRDPNNIIGSDRGFKGFKCGKYYSSLEKSSL